MPDVQQALINISIDRFLLARAPFVTLALHGLDSFLPLADKTQYAPLDAPPVAVPPGLEGGYVDPQYAGQDQYGYEAQYG